jgi:X-X-X-Leu-X-X-Gly heptad repeat protein
MGNEQQEKLGFREWTIHYEKEQEADREKINTLADGLAQVNQSVGRLTANVETLIDNQKGMFNRINRPTQWGVLVSAALLVAVILGLVTGPMKEEISDLEAKVAMETNRNIELHIMFNNRLGEQIKLSTANETNIQWIIRMEERTNNRLHERAINND